MTTTWAGIAARTVGVLAVLALAAGCSGGGKGDDGASDEASMGPLDKYFQASMGADAEKSDEEWQAESEAQMAEEQRLIAECMTAQGFEYYPEDNIGTVSYSSGDEEQEGPQWGTLEFAKLYGYGVFNSPGQESAIAEPAPTYTPTTTDKYLESMTDSEREAYSTALSGEQPDWDKMTKEEQETYEWKPGGCQAEAQEKVYGSSSWGEPDPDRPYADLEDAITQMYQSMDTDSRAQAVNADWAGCMADSGHGGFDKPGDAEQSVYDQSNGLWEDAPQDAQGNVDEAWLENKQAEYSKDEVALATADYTCRSTINYDKRRQDINFAMQQEFLDQHKAELDSWIQWQAQQRSASASPSTSAS